MTECRALWPGERGGEVVDERLHLVVLDRRAPRDPVLHQLLPVAAEWRWVVTTSIAWQPRPHSPECRALWPGERGGEVVDERLHLVVLDRRAPRD
ncbi:MAG: hypothetical protein ACK527_00640, partial [Acidobacteriota bacterium]